MGLPLETVEYKTNGGGLNLKNSPTKVPEDESSRHLNVDYSTDGAFLTRNGSSIVNVAGVPPIPAQMAGAPKTLNISGYRNSAGISIDFITAGTTIKSGLVTPTNVITGLSALLPYPDTEFVTTGDGEFMIWGNGINTNLKFDGTTWTNLSMPRPTAPTFAADGAPVGGFLLAGTYDYYVSFVRIVAGVIVQESQLSLVGTHIIAAPQTINIIIPIAAEVLLAGVTAQVNGRVLYRKNNTTGDIVRVTPGNGVTIAGNAAFTYPDSTPDALLPDPPVFADFSYIAAPISKIFENYAFNGNRVFYISAARPTDMYYAQTDRPWNVINDPFLFDGPVKCLKRLFGSLTAGTDRSLWNLYGDITQISPNRVSSQVGILNNRCAAGDDGGVLYLMGNNYKVYSITPTMLSQNEIRFSDPLSLKIDPLFSNINTTDPEIPCMELYTSASVAKMILSVPIGAATNNTLIIYNQSQAVLLQKPVWEIWDNINASYLVQLTVSTVINLYSGDYNGFLWKLDDSSLHGDGAEINGFVTAATATTLTETLVAGTATAGGANTLTDAGLAMTINEFTGFFIEITAGTGVGQVRTIGSNTATTFTVTVAWGVVPDATSVYKVGRFFPNAYVGMTVRIIDGFGENQVRTIISNDTTTLTVAAWTTIPNTSSEYTVGGYDVYHFSNWKAVVSGYDFLKQLWFIWVNANASGNYTIDLIVQIDFNQSITAQVTLPLNLIAGNAIWNEFLWGAAIWGAFEVFEDRLRYFTRFRAIRLGFLNRKAGQPFQINTFSLSVQDKKLFFRTPLVVL